VRVQWASVLSECNGRIIVTLCPPLTRMRCTQWNRKACTLSLQAVAQFLTNKLSCDILKVNWPVLYLYVTYVYFFPHSSEVFLKDRKCVYSAVRPQVCVQCIEVRPYQSSVACLSPTKWHSCLSLSAHHSCTYRTSGSADTRVLSLLRAHPRTSSLTNNAQIPDNFQYSTLTSQSSRLLSFGACKVLELLFLFDAGGINFLLCRNAHYITGWTPADE
jgi:hypothetical protein